MEKTIGKRKVVKKVEAEEVVITCKFEANILDYHEELIIENGEIQETGSWDSRNGGGCRKGDYGFTDRCYSTIRFIVKHKPEELKNIYNALSDGVMKDFCRKLQKEKMAELDF